ncbi:GDSL esterase/lipase At5g45960-like [Sesamum indicum]|uniref:GDSL esterase/lipase At5g45960-like n=1 Tax=Sesamum indicum TaxID=4182 RepID=A0A6I9TKT1_SESIN|nr:GDSL esterase/lipase At5g45960-like [Sesamum indicum]
MLWSAGGGFPSPLRFLLLLLIISIAESAHLKRPFNNSVPAVVVFGDSTVDSGNNNYVKTPFKSNFPPYGKDFVNGVPTGRFTDGRLVTDFMATYVGIKEYVPPYLDPNLTLEDLMTGVCFASAGSGFDPLTAQLSGVISVQRQLEYFKEYKAKLEAAIGKERTKTLISKAAFLISAGTNDIVLNYFATPFRRQTYNITSYQQFLLEHVKQFIQGLREEGAKVIGLVGLPPIGCLPIVITVTSGEAEGERRCNHSLSSIALDYNQKLQKMLEAMQNSSSTIIYYADIYKPLNDIIQRPSRYGFDNVNSGCCGSGLIETTFMCNPASLVCANPSKYLFFDSVHPTQAAYSFLYQALRPTVDRVIKIHDL